MFDSMMALCRAASRAPRAIAAVTASLAFASTPALAQTTFGASTTIVFPVASNSVTFTSQITLYNSNPVDVTVSLDYFDANNLPSPGMKPCNDVVLPANRSVALGLPANCTLGAGSHFGVLIVSDVAATHEIFGYIRTQNNSGAGFSVEGFPLDNFATGPGYSIGLVRTAAAPTYQTNCFVGSLADPLTYDLTLFDDTTGAQIGNTISGSLGSFAQIRYLDVFAAAAAPAGDYTNVRAQFTRTSAGSQQMIGFCTVQDDVSFGADFRIAKSITPAASPPASPLTLSWQGAIGTVPAHTSGYVFAGPTATASLGSAGYLSASGSGSFAKSGSSVSITIAVCSQNQSGPGPLTPMGATSTFSVTKSATSHSAAGSVALPAGNYKVGLCATNGTSGIINRNGSSNGFAFVTP